VSKDLEKKPLKYGYYNTIKCTKVEWLWYPYIPYGKITIIQGDPGEGKSTFAMNLTALLTNGGETPFTKVRIEPSTVVYQNSEDGKEDTIVPRLNACGADLKKVAYIDEYDSSLAMDDSRLDKVLEETGARVLILDPIQAYFGEGTDMNRANDIRPIMQRLSKMASVRRCAVILIGHMSKSKTATGIYRSLGSIDIPASARSVLLISKLDEENGDRRILAQIKNNLAPIGDSIVFRIGNDSKIQWERRSRLTAEQVIDDDFDNPNTKCTRAIDMIEEMLADGEVLGKSVIESCKKLGMSERTINEAKAKLGVKSIKKKDGWYWTNGTKD